MHFTSILSTHIFRHNHQSTELKIFTLLGRNNAFILVTLYQSPDSNEQIIVIPATFLKTEDKLY